MISRRSFLSAAPVAVMAAPQIAQALPAPMPVVDAGPFPPTPAWTEDHPRTLVKIWRAWKVEQDKMDGVVRASTMRARMEDVVEQITGYRPPFILRHHDGSHDEFIFHRVASRIEGKVMFCEELRNQPCYVIEWTPDHWRHVMGDKKRPDYSDTGMLEYMAAFCFFDHKKVIYDL